MALLCVRDEPCQRYAARVCARLKGGASGLIDSWVVAHAAVTNLNACVLHKHDQARQPGSNPAAAFRVFATALGVAKLDGKMQGEKSRKAQNVLHVC